MANTYVFLPVLSSQSNAPLQLDSTKKMKHTCNMCRGLGPYPRSALIHMSPWLIPAIVCYSLWEMKKVGYCWYFVTSTSDTRLSSMIPITASEMPDIRANNALTFVRAITGNQDIMNHELFRKRMELPV